MNAQTRTLYLYADNRTRVLRDGKSLRVRKLHRADRFYSIVRISNVISSNKVQWDSNALMLCASHHVNIHFISGRGDIVACFNAPCPVDTEGMQTQVNQYASLPDSKQRFQRWLAVQHHNVICQIAGEMHVGHKRLHGCGLDELIKTKLNGKIRHKEYKTYCQHILALHQSAMSRHLETHAVDRQHIAFALLGYNLDAAMAKLGTLRFIPAMLRDLQHHARAIRKEAGFRECLLNLRAIKLFEQHKSKQLDRMERHCRQFLQHVYETLRDTENA